MAQTVKVAYASNGKDTAELERTRKEVIQPIKHRYLDGSVQTSSGDVWNVIPCKTADADFFAVPPEYGMK